MIVVSPPILVEQNYAVLVSVPLQRQVFFHLTKKTNVSLERSLFRWTFGYSRKRLPKQCWNRYCFELLSSSPAGVTYTNYTIYNISPVASLRGCRFLTSLIFETQASHSWVYTHFVVGQLLRTTYYVLRTTYDVRRTAYDVLRTAYYVRTYFVRAYYYYCHYY